MKNKFYGGKNAFIQTEKNLQPFTTLLKINPRPFIFDNTQINFSTRLFVNNIGELKVIQQSKLN